MLVCVCVCVTTSGVNCVFAADLERMGKLSGLYNFRRECDGRKKFWKMPVISTDLIFVLSVPHGSD